MHKNEEKCALEWRKHAKKSGGGKQKIALCNHLYFMERQTQESGTFCGDISTEPELANPSKQLE